MGFRARELMFGYHELQDGGGRQPFGFRASWGPERLRDWLNPTCDRFLWQTLEGEVLAGGLCDWTPCSGTLEFEYLSKARIRYRFDFEVDGTVYHYVGDKVNIRPWNLATSHRTCFGTVTERSSDRLVSTSVTFFKLRHLPKLLASVRLR